MNAISRKAFTCLFCAWFTLASTFGTVASAQSTEFDFEAPIIEHEEITTGILGDVAEFVATVVDNAEVESVSLFYRYAGEDDFIEVIMQPLLQSSSYTTTINTAARSGEDTAIEYYIRAEDTSKNMVLKGLSFNPLVRTLINPNLANITADQAPTPEQSAPVKKINWLYVGLGALLVGGIAAAAGGGGSDGNNVISDPGAQPGCDPCTITLTLSPP
ncbi:MAG: hypothetical protein AB8B64_06275 [Granulosicoccus sp.]